MEIREKNEEEKLVIEKKVSDSINENKTEENISSKKRVSTNILDRVSFFNKKPNNEDYKGNENKPKNNFIPSKKHISEKVNIFEVKSHEGGEKDNISNVRKKLDLEGIFKKMNIKPTNNNDKMVKKEGVKNITNQKNIINKKPLQNLDKIKEQEIKMKKNIDIKGEINKIEINKIETNKKEENKKKEIIKDEIIKEENIVEDNKKEEIIKNEIIKNEIIKNEIINENIIDNNKIIKEDNEIKNENKNKIIEEKEEKIEENQQSNNENEIKEVIKIEERKEEKIEEKEINKIEDENEKNDDNKSKSDESDNNKKVKIENEINNKIIENNLNNDKDQNNDDEKEINIINIKEEKESNYESFINDKLILNFKDIKKEKIIIGKDSHEDSIKNDEKYEEIFLDIRKSKESEIRETFCECFFITSIPEKDGKIVENSIGFSPCGHKFCAKIPSMHPEIVYKYPKETKKIELNNLAASICYPQGIKICFQDSDEKQYIPKNYRTLLINQAGDKFFVVTYHFLVKMSSSDYNNYYEKTPDKYLLTTHQEQITLGPFNDKKDTTLSIEEVTNISMKDYLYVPFCACLVSKYPYFKQMDKALKSILITLKNKTLEPQDFNGIISYIVKSIPIPTKNTNVSFVLPYINKICDIRYPYIEEVLQFGNNNLYIILSKLSVNHIICIFKLILFEQKIIVIGKNNDIISQIILSFLSLIYPCEWFHTLIPLMSEKMIKFLQSFMPYFNGMNLTVFEQAKPILIAAAKGIFIIDLENDKIELNTNYNKKEKYTKGCKFIHKSFPNFPKRIETLLNKELKALKSEMELITQDKYLKEKLFKINLRLKILFLYSFVEIFLNYNKYSYIIDDYPVFNNILMCQEKEKSDQEFYKGIAITQMFQMFIQKSLFKEQRTLFDEFMDYYIELKDNKKVKPNDMFSKFSEQFTKKYKSYNDVNIFYKAKPYFLNVYEKFEKNYEKDKKIVASKDMALFIKEIFGQQKYEHPKIIDNKDILQLHNSNDPENYVIYEFKQTVEDNKIKNKKSVGDSSSLGSKHKSFRRMRLISTNTKNNFVNCPNYLRDEILSEDQKDDIKDTIREIMTKVYKSEKLSVEEDKRLLLDSVKTDFGFDYFVSIIYPINIKERMIKFVQQNSFDFLKEFILNSILKFVKEEETEKNLIWSLRLIKASFYIKTLVKNKEILLTDELFQQFDNNPVFQRDNFWEKYIEDELTPSEKDLYLLFQNDPNDEPKIETENSESYFNHIFEILIKIPHIMLKMRLSTEFIYTKYTNIIKKFKVTEEQDNKLMQELISQLAEYKKNHSNEIRQKLEILK